MHSHNVWVSEENRVLERRGWGGVGWGFTTAEERGTGVNHSSLMSLPEVGEIIHDNLIKTPSPHVVGEIG